MFTLQIMSGLPRSSLIHEPMPRWDHLVARFPSIALRGGLPSSPMALQEIMVELRQVPDGNILEPFEAVCVTFAVKVTGWPNNDGFCDDNTDVVVLNLASTVIGTAFESGESPAIFEAAAVMI